MTTALFLVILFVLVPLLSVRHGVDSRAGFATRGDYAGRGRLAGHGAHGLRQQGRDTQNAEHEQTREEEEARAHKWKSCLYAFTKCDAATRFAAAGC